MYMNLTGYEIYVGSKENLVENLKECLLSKNSKSKLNIISGNPEVLLNGINNERLNKFFKRNDSIIIPDGIGVTMLLKILKKCFIKKIAGIEIMEELLKISNDNSLGVYFLGAKFENLKFAVKNINNMYPKIDIKGFSDGYFDDEKLVKIIDDIKNTKPDVLFIAMGSPKQEIFISDYMDELDCKIFMGVGGSFDLYSGKIKRAPKIMINFGLEWLYRVSNEPSRIRRLSSIPKFMFESIKYYFKDKKIND